MRCYLVYAIIGVSIFSSSCKKDNKTLPIITTNEITGITTNSAISGGNISSDGGAKVTERGVCWDILSNPSTASEKTLTGNGIGSFTSNITNLMSDTKYYVRAYATNSEGTSYGDEVSFTTSPVLMASLTTTVDSISAHSIYAGGNITSDGGSTVTSKGVCWSTNNNPTINENKTSDGTGEGVYASFISGLSSNTKYYLRAYATNEVGTNYGNEIEVVLWLDQPGPQISDNSGNIYNTVRIGNQYWMKENLKTITYNNGATIKTTSTADLNIYSETNPKYQWAYKGDESYVDTYGRLYTWYVVNDSRGICPVGWHVPSDEEWHTLIEYLDSSAMLVAVAGIESYNAGGMLKETGTEHWLSPNSGATNGSGFIALASGARKNGTTSVSWSPIGEISAWWSATERDTYYAWDRAIDIGTYATQYTNYNLVYKDYIRKSWGFSVRCLKD